MTTPVSNNRPLPLPPVHTEAEDSAEASETRTTEAPPPTPNLPLLPDPSMENIPPLVSSRCSGRRR